MKRVVIAGRDVEVDADATAAAYAKRSRGAPEECGCLHCRNFVAARDRLYPREVIEILDSLGIHAIRDAEIWHVCELRPGVHSYGGFMHAVGRILSAQDATSPVGQSARQMCPEPIAPVFSLGLTSDAQLVPDCFPRSGLFQIEFECEVPWVLDEPYDGPGP